MKRYTDEERIQRVWDVIEIKNVMARHAYYHQYGLHGRELDEIWVKEPEHMATASFGQNAGYQVGMDLIRLNYVIHDEARAREQLEAYRKLDPSIPDKPEYARMGVGGMHSLMTPLIYVAEDGETAQGMWHSPGQITFSEPGGDGLPEGHCMWMYERYAVDFIKENGEWKIWHLLIGTDTAMPVGGCITDEIIDLERPAPAAEAGEDPYAMELTFTFPAYDSRFNWPEYPPLPKPYRTFSETVSYGPEGNPLYGGQK